MKFQVATAFLALLVHSSVSVDQLDKKNKGNVIPEQRYFYSKEGRLQNGKRSPLSMSLRGQRGKLKLPAHAAAGRPNDALEDAKRTDIGILSFGDENQEDLQEGQDDRRLGAMPERNDTVVPPPQKGGDDGAIIDNQGTKIYDNLTSCVGPNACSHYYDYANHFVAGSHSCLGELSCADAGNYGHFEVSDFSCLKNKACYDAGYHYEARATVGFLSCVGVKSCFEAGLKGIAQIGNSSCLGPYACARVGKMPNSTFEIGSGSCVAEKACYFHEKVEQARNITIGEGSCNCIECCKDLKDGSIIGDCQCNSIDDGCADSLVSKPDSACDQGAVPDLGQGGADEAIINNQGTKIYDNLTSCVGDKACLHGPEQVPYYFYAGTFSCLGDNACYRAGYEGSFQALNYTCMGEYACAGAGNAGKAQMASWSCKGPYACYHAGFESDSNVIIGKGSCVGEGACRDMTGNITIGQDSCKCNRCCAELRHGSVIGDNQCNSEQEPCVSIEHSPALPGIFLTARAEGRFKTLFGAVQERREILELVTGGEKFTLFAPNDDAFNALPAGTAKYFHDLPDVFTRTLKHHLVTGEHLSNSFEHEMSMNPVFGPDIVMTIVDGTIHADSATLVTTNITASNGVIHEINQVLLPPEVQLPDNIVQKAIQVPPLSKFMEAVVATNMTDTLTESILTVFAPTNGAISRMPAGAFDYLLENPDLLSDILKHCVVPGWKARDALTNGPGTITALDGNNLTISTDGNGQLQVNTFPFVGPPIITLNGVIHVIDGVLVPPGFTLPPNVVEVANATETLSKFAKYIEAAGLVDVLSKETFTLFAPNDEAFAEFPYSEEELLNGGKLGTLLYNHMVGNTRVMASNLTSTSGLTITHVNDDVFVNDARIIDPDIVALNGVIHVIDKVLVPADFGADKKQGSFSCVGEKACDHTAGSPQLFYVEDFSCRGNYSCFDAGLRGTFQALDYSCLKAGSCRNAAIHGDARVGLQSCVGTNSCNGAGWYGSALIGNYSCIGPNACENVALDVNSRVAIGKGSCVGERACDFDQSMSGNVTIGDGSCKCAGCCSKLPAGSTIRDDECNSLSDGCSHATSVVVKPEPEPVGPLNPDVPEDVNRDNVPAGVKNVGSESCVGTDACTHHNVDTPNYMSVGDFSCQGRVSCRRAGERGFFQVSDYCCLDERSCFYLAGQAETASARVGFQSCVGHSSCFRAGSSGAVSIGDWSCIGTSSCYKAGNFRSANVTIGNGSCVGELACDMTTLVDGDVVIGNGSCNCPGCCAGLPAGSMIGDCLCNSVGDPCYNVTDSNPVVLSGPGCPPLSQEWS